MHKFNLSLIEKALPLVFYIITGILLQGFFVYFLRKMLEIFYKPDKIDRALQLGMFLAFDE